MPAGISKSEKLLRKDMVRDGIIKNRAFEQSVRQR